MSHLSKITDDLLEQSKKLYLLNNKLHSQINNLSGEVNLYDNPFESINKDAPHISYLEHILKANQFLLGCLENNIERLTHSTLKFK